MSSIMCSYNRLNQTYSCQHSKSLNGILKDELGFQGYVMSDWGATHSGLASVLAGLDMDQPGPQGAGDSTQESFFGYNISTMVQNGSVSETRLDDMVKRILTPYYWLDQENYPTVDLDTAQINSGIINNTIPTYQHPFNLGSPADINRDVRGDHDKVIREIGAASAVLLKNMGAALPLKQPKRIAVFGNDAADLSGGPYDPGEENGVQAAGGGSGTGRFTNLISPLEAIKQRNPQALVEYVTDNKLITQNTRNTVATVYPRPDVCLVFLKSFATEGSDRASLLLDYNSTAVVETVTSSAACPNTVVVTNSAGPNILPWADSDNITAIVAGHYPGEQVGNSIVDVLFGDVNPSGKLPYTIAYNEGDYNAPIVNISNPDTSNPNQWQSNFTEGLLIDYRHFDYSNITPRYEFGFGLSYTTFSVSNLQVSKTGGMVAAYPPSLGSKPAPPGGNAALYDVVATVQVDVKNTGNVAGAAVPQLYVGFPADPDGDSSPTPVKVLRGFEKTDSLKPGQSVTVKFDLRRKDLSAWDVVKQQWGIPSGDFKIWAGQSSRDLPLTDTLSVL
jgi:beta-glucosidase